MTGHGSFVGHTNFAIRALSDGISAVESAVGHLTDAGLAADDRIDPIDAMAPSAVNIFVELNLEALRFALDRVTGVRDRALG